MLRILSDPRCLEHAAPPGYPERKERLAGILRQLRAEAPARGWELVEQSPGGEARERARATALLLHDEGYIERFARAVHRGDGLLDSADNPLSEGTWEAAWAAVETSLAAADWVAAGEDRCALAAVRPPGHHAERATAMGFCFLNNVALAAEHLRRRHGASRVAIFDFDVHHGNGTQHLFEARADVFYASVHQYPFYPGTGAAAETGSGPGEGATLNVPLPAGTGDEGYAEAILKQVMPALERFAPEVLLLSAGFDAWRADPLGGMAVSQEAFQRWGEWLGELAARRCGGRVVAVLEGGYDLSSLPLLVTAHLTGLAGDSPAAEQESDASPG